MPEFMHVPGSPEGLEHKAVAANPGTGLLNADDATGVVEALVSVTGIPDQVNDVIEPGAYTKTLATRKPKGIFGHDWQKWVARTEAIKELMPGDPALPSTTPDGKPWPAKAGALYVKARFNLGTPEGAAGYSNVKFFSETGECQWSVGYKVTQGKGLRTKTGQRTIKAPDGMDLYEYSPVLFGAAPETGTLTVKDAISAGPAELEAKATDPDADPNRWATDDPSDPVDPDTREADADDPTMAALHAEMIREVSAQADGWDAVDAASAINPGEEEITSDTAAMLRDADERRQGVKAAGVDALEVKDGTKVSDKPWSGFSQADYTPAQWHAACLVHNHAVGPGGVGGDGMTKADCKLPVAEPDGTLNRNAVHAAAGRLGQLDASDDQKNAAAAKLRSLYGKIGDDAPDSLSTKTAGQDVTPADHAAADRLKQWYEHGGGAAQIGWGKAGDFDACVAIAGKHMEPDKARGYCQLRHKGATGHYAGHAPGEQAGHGAAAATVGKKGVIDPETLSEVTVTYDTGSPANPTEFKVRVGEGESVFSDGVMAGKAAAYDPALEQGEYAGHLPSEVKALATEAPFEERVDAVTAAVTAAVGSTVPGEAGMPRKLVTVHGTWPDRALASVHDAHGSLTDAKSFSVPYSYDPDAGVTLGDPEPVTLTLPASDGTKALGGEGEALSAVPVLVEYVAGFIRRGLASEVKAGRVLSDSNAKLLQGAHQQLVTVLRGAGIPFDGQDDNAPDEDEQALNDETSSPLYLPDSTAPAAQAAGTKVALDPELLSRASLITAAAVRTED